MAGEPSFLVIPSKPTAPISYTFIPPSSAGSPPPNRLIIFLNGLALPASSWQPSISLLGQSTSTAGILTYDRFGQGLTTSLDPSDEETEPGYGHGYLSVIADLHEIIEWVSSTYYTEAEGGEEVKIILVGASIGSVIARLYTQQHPSQIAALILLDSNIPNVDYTTILPDPSSPSVNPADLVADDCTLEQYIEARKRAGAMFDLGVINREKLDRRTGKELLPYADAPRFEGRGIVLAVVGHDKEEFADQGLKTGTPRSVTLKFLQPYWEKYNAELLKISDELLDEEILIAKGCGHFIQVDDPIFVAELVGRMVKRLGW